MKARQPSATRQKADLVRSMWLCTAEGILAMPIVMVSLPVNVVLTALFTQAFPLPKTTIGLISAMPFLGNFLQVFIAPVIARWHPPKTITVAAATLHLLTWIALGIFLPLVPRDAPETAGWIFVSWFLLSSIFSAIAGVSWNAWIQEWVPARLRGKYFGRRNGILQISNLSFLLVAGWVLSRYEYSIAAFQAVVVGSCIVRVLSIRWQWISPTRPHRPSQLAHLPLAGQFGVLLNARSFLGFIAFGMVWAFAANCFGPFYHVFLFQELGYSAFDVGLLSTISQLGGALSLPAWGQLLDRHGNKPVMLLSFVLWQVSNVAWCWLTPGNSSMLYAMWAWAGITSAGFVLGQFTILLRLIPIEAKNLALGLNLAVVSLVAAAAPVIGGKVLSVALARGGSALDVYHACFALQPLLALAGCFLLFRVHEPQASPFSSVVGAMRNIRTLSGVLGLGFLVNYVFFRDPRRDRK